MFKIKSLFPLFILLMVSCNTINEKQIKNSSIQEMCNLKIFNHFQLDSVLCSIKEKGKKLSHYDPENDFILITFDYNKSNDTTVDFSYEKFRPAIIDESIEFKKFINQKDIKVLIIDNVKNPVGEKFYNFKHFQNDNDTIFEYNKNFIDDTPYERIDLKFQFVKNKIIPM